MTGAVISTKSSQYSYKYTHAVISQYLFTSVCSIKYDLKII